MYVSVGGVSSNAKDVYSGVRQGSVLGPILFLIYVNFLTDGLVSKHGAFTDDYKIYLPYSRNNLQEWHADFARGFG